MFPVTLLYASAALGAIVIAKTFLSFLSMLKYIVLPSSQLNRCLEKDAYAVVTGASDGIGKEYALQLAQKGFNIVLMARSKDKLDFVAAEIVKMGRKALVIPFDFAENTGYAALQKQLESLKITVLVNNVGVSHEMPTPFLIEDKEWIDRIVQVNVLSVLRITKLILPRLVQQRKGLVLNMGSLSGMAPAPFLSVYGATKAFLRSWSMALALEVARDGVHVELLNTMYVATAMARIKRSSFMVPSAAMYVKSVLRGAGQAALRVPYYSHALVVWFIETFVPEKVLMKTMAYELSQVRQRALKKKERMAAGTASTSKKKA